MGLGAPHGSGVGACGALRKRGVGAGSGVGRQGRQGRALAEGKARENLNP